MRKIKSLISTLLVSGGVFGALYFTPIEIGNKIKKESKFAVVEEEEELLGEEFPEETVEVPPIIEMPIEEPKPESIDIADTPAPQPSSAEPNKIEKEALAKKEEQKRKEKEREKAKEKKLANQKTTEEAKKQPQKEKESKIGIDRKLIAGIPGTQKYKGVFPPHNVKEKGSITIAYTVNPEGNVISAYRVDGLKDKNTINNAATLVRKYVKAEKAKTNSTGTYTINFK